MDKKSLLRCRLKQIAQSIEEHPNGLGLLGLGSAGIEMDRMDEYSDLDFFAIVKKGCKQRFIEDLSWLSDISAIAWCFRNTEDGYKLLYADGVFCEFAVFEPEELQHIDYSEGGFVWRHPDLEESLRKPNKTSARLVQNEEFLLGELLSNLYVGLCRYRRGELISAMRFIQVYAFDRLVSLLDASNIMPQSAQSYVDDFCPDRRLEQRYPEHKSLFQQCCLGVQRSPESAASMLEFVKQHYEVNEAIEREIRELLSTSYKKEKPH